MREIKFRGYSSMLNKWIYGPGMKFDKSGKASIFYNNGWYNVGNTGGQFTGLTDRNGVEIRNFKCRKFTRSLH